MGVTKQERYQLHLTRKREAIHIYTSLNGDISMKELGEKIGVSIHSAEIYIRDYFKAIRDTKF